MWIKIYFNYLIIHNWVNYLKLNVESDCLCISSNSDYSWQSVLLHRTLDLLYSWCLILPNQFVFCVLYRLTVRIAFHNLYYLCMKFRRWTSDFLLLQTFLLPRLKLVCRMALCCFCSSLDFTVYYYSGCCCGNGQCFCSQ